MSSFFYSSTLDQENPLRRERGQGLVEYALILVLVAVVVIAVIAVLGPSVGQVYEQIVCVMYGGTIVAIDSPDPYCVLPDGRSGNYFDLGVPGVDGA